MNPNLAHSFVPARARRASAWISLAALALIFTWSLPLVAAPAGLNSRAQAEISALLQEKASWTPAQRKMESHLVHALKRHRGQAFAPGVPNLKLSVKNEPDGRMLVEINARVTPALLTLIQQGGGQVVSKFPQFRAVRALVTLDQLETLAGSDDVVSIRQADQAYNNVGSVNSEGDTTHRAATARANFGATGAGIKIGVLSDSVTFLASSQASSNLGPVTVLPGQGGSGNGEGTAMLEIIHDLAPDAQLYFATAFNGQASFAQNILDLRSNGCDIIVDDVEYFAEPVFQDGIIAQAVNSVTAGGALYFSSAGNSGNLDAGTSGTWEGDFVDGGAAAPPIPESGRMHSFGPSIYNAITSGGSLGLLTLSWSDPVGASTNDYDVFVLNPYTGAVMDCSMSVQDGSQDPYETCSADYGNVVIVKYSGEGRFMHLNIHRGGLSLNTSGVTKGHAAAAAGFGVAAVDVATAFPIPFTGGGANPVESFSSDGPRRIFYNADGTAITPGNYSSTGGTVRQKPDIAAADGVATSVPYFKPFFGTSAAAPHAAAVAALLWSYNHALTTSQIRNLLTGTALDIGPAGIDRDSGAGIVMAVQAMEALDQLRITPSPGLISSGPVGGPFNPSCQSYTLTNPGNDTIGWTAAPTAPWVSVSPTSGSLAPGATNAVAICLTAAAASFGLGTNTAGIIFSNTTSGARFTREVMLTVTTPRVVLFSLDTDPGWSRQGEWAFGRPAGLGGSTNYPEYFYFGWPDPTNGATGSNVFGINLNGDYSTTAGGPYYLTAGPFDFSRYTNTKLKFQRWLNTDYQPYAYSTVEISTNGSTWSLVWSNANGAQSTTITDTNWMPVAYNISTYADNRGSVYVRWGHRVTAGAFGLSGWNIDDIEFQGTPPPLSLTVPAIVTEGGGTVTGTVAVTRSSSSNLVVSLSSSDTSEITVPSTATIFAGQTNATFVITPEEDAILDGSQIVTIAASATERASVTAVMSVLDNETATLAVSLPASATEGDGPVSGTVSVSAAPGKDVRVSLFSSNTNEIQVPAFVTVPSGATSAVFTITIVNDTQFDGDQTATVTAHVEYWTDGMATITVHDNEASSFALMFPAQAREGKGVLTNAGTVSVPGALQTNLTISLLSDDTTEITVPASVLILAGQVSAAFDLTIVDDLDLDGPQTATVTASAPSFASAFRSITVTDNETPLAPTNPVPPHLSTTNPVTTGLAWSPAPGDPGAPITYDVYFGTNPTPGPAELLGSTTATSWALPALAPLTTYFWQLVAHRSGQVSGPVWQFTTRGVDHFAWSAIGSTQFINVPFDVAITAKDSFNTTVSNFTGTVALTGSWGPTQVFADNFEDGTFTDWIIGLGNYTREISVQTAAGGSKSLTLIGGSQSHHDGVRHSLPNVTPSRVTYYVRASATNVAGGYFVLSGDGNDAIFFFMDTNGKFYLDSAPSVPYIANRWYKISFVINWSTKRFDYYVDDILKAANLSFRTSVSSFTSLDLYNYDSTQAWWDEIEFIGLAPVTFSPTTTGNFVNGTWSGQVSVLQGVTNVTLAATDANSHTGASNPFNVLATNDVSLTMTASADPLPFSSSLTYTVTVVNSGPATATGVVLSNALPASANLVSVTVSQGTCANFGNLLVCNLGSLGSGATNIVSIVVVPTTTGSLTNQADLWHEGTDPYPGNDSAQLVTSVLPGLSINDISVVEGNTGSMTSAVLTVSLFPASSGVASVFYSAGGGTATYSDYGYVAGMLVFKPGQTNETISVPIYGNLAFQSNRTLYVSLYQPTNAAIGRSQGAITIIEDDTLLASIPDLTVSEGTLLTFTPTNNAFLPENQVETWVADFDNYSLGSANGARLFRNPRNSGSTSGFLDAAPDVSLLTNNVPAGNTNPYSFNGLKVSWSFAAAAVNPWLRLTTLNPTFQPNPTVSFNGHLVFDIYSERALKVGLGLRETSTTAAIGANGGTTGAIEWAGVSAKNGSQPVPSRTVTASNWTTLDFYLPTEAITNFSGGNNVLDSTTGKGVLEHLALVPAAGNGTYTIYLDNFKVVTNRFTFSLDAGAPAGATINPFTGVFIWTPSEAQGPGVYPITIRLRDPGNPNLGEARTFTVTVNESNSAPVLAAVGARTIHAGTTLTVTNSASDPDIPVNTLTFSLDPGAPSGATIGPASGLLVWTPTDAQLGSNSFTVRVTDNGTPQLSDAKNFNVTVMSRPQIALSISGTNATLLWTAISGQAYYVQSKDDLNNTNWTDLLPAITGSGPTVLWTDPAGAVPRRFYRIRLQ